MTLAPIILFAYNRKDHLEKTITALKQNALAIETNLFIFSDGPKIPSDEKVSEVRKFIKTISGFKTIEITEAEKNKGLASSIVEGVTRIINKYGKAIILEDDVITSPYFLDYMNQSLDLYENDEQVMHISGYMFPIDGTKLDEAFFLKPTSCWGWATWKRAWTHFSNNIQEIEKKMTGAKKREFNMDGSHDYYSQIRLNKEKKIKTWAIFWYASCFLNNGLSLHPKKSFCHNIGIDGSGTNCAPDEVFDVQLNQTKPDLKRIGIQENLEARKQLINFYNKNRIPLFERVIRKSKKIVGIK